MSFKQNVGAWLGLPSKTDMEQLTERVATQELLLSENASYTPETGLSYSSKRNLKK